jgi:hypothetical protein
MKAVITSVAMLLMFASATHAETFEILNPPGNTGDVVPSVIQNGIVGGSFDVDVSQIAFTFSRKSGYTTFDVPEHRFFLSLVPAGIDSERRVYGIFANTDGGFSSFVREPNGDIEKIDYPAPNVQITAIIHVNVRGTSVGRYGQFDEATGVLVSSGFMRLGTGQIVPLRYPHASITVASANNDNGEIVGYAGFNGQRADTPFFRGALGPWKLFALPPGCATYSLVGAAIFLNNAGTAASQCEVAPDTLRGFIRSKSGELISFNVPGSLSTTVAGIADNGYVAGSYTDAVGTHAYIRRADATYFKFDAPTAPPGTTLVKRYSAEGDLVGTFRDTQGVTHGFVRYKQ